MNFTKISLILMLGVHGVVGQNFSWQNANLPFEKRVELLANQLTLEEKVSLLKTEAPAIKRLGVKAYNWSHECLHGVARAGKATIFPQAIGLAATFDSALVHEMAIAISDEARAKHEIFARKNLLGEAFTGLTFFSPNINIYRDPRWGRGMETYGEDPFLTAKIGVAFVKGLQGNDPLYLKTAACAKHFVAHSGPEKDRQLNNPTPSKKDLNETYLPHFKALIQEAGVATVMTTYNKLYGIPLCASSYANRNLLRKHLGFKGMIMTDGGALNHMHKSQKYTKNMTYTCAAALNAGINFELGDQFDSLSNSVKMGLISEKHIDTAVRLVLKIRFQLGLMDTTATNPYAKTDTNCIHSPKHQELARRLATASIVLLKNKNQVLPLSKNINKLYVVGPNATNGDVLLGNYNGFSGNLSVPLEGLVKAVSKGTILEYRPGCRLDQENITKADWTDVSHSFDAIVAYMGLSPVIEGEEGEAISSPGEGDRLDLDLPQNQVAYLKKQRAYGYKPIILVLFGGSPIINKEIYDLADAVLYCWYPGEEGGNAIADIIFGNVSPSGKLPITFPMSVADLPPFEDYSMKDRTYKFMKKDPLFPFGFGLSYTKFSLSNLTVSKSVIRSGESISVKVMVTNVGDVPSHEVVQLYVTLPEVAFERPNYALKGIKKIYLQPGESKWVHFDLPSKLYSGFDAKGNEIVYKGKYTLHVADASPHPKSVLLGATKPVTATFTVQ